MQRFSEKVSKLDTIKRNTSAQIVVDADYLDATRDPDAAAGRKVPLTVDEVRRVRAMLPGLAEAMVLHFEGLP